MTDQPKLIANWILASLPRKAYHRIHAQLDAVPLEFRQVLFVTVNGKGSR